ncbi:hypothetical protein [Trichlorobacter lovleyi]|uniref:hypothetical protein n=1 Tax=Trichlorobacter lovleyi TaxID=313985 RepID=UPI003D147D05
MSNDRKSNPIATAFVLLVVVAALGIAGNEDRKDKEVTQENIRQVAAVGIVYSRPAAYRLQSPTPEQMSHLEHLLAVQQVAR